MRSIVLVLVTLFSLSTFAKDGSSGCGPGWYIMKKKSILSSALRITTNGILFPFVTLGMTFGTSNCTKHSLVKTERKSLYFITQNYFELKGDSAKGKGDFLTAYGKTIGCKSDDLEYFSGRMQNDFQNIFKEEIDNEEVLLETYKVILADPVLVKSCSLS
jgi:hypothetical protein